MMMTERAKITAGVVLELHPNFLFRWEEPQQAHVLLYPEGVIKLNETGAAILELCNGRYSVDEIISELNNRYRADVAESINKFLEVAHAKGWIRIKS